MRGEVDLAEAAFADQLAQRVVADAREVGRGEFTARMSMTFGIEGGAGLLEKLLVRVCELQPSVLVVSLRCAPSDCAQRTFFLCAACSAAALGFMRSATCAWRRACCRRHSTPRADDWPAPRRGDGRTSQAAVRGGTGGVFERSERRRGGGSSPESVEWQSRSHAVTQSRSR